MALPAWCGKVYSILEIVGGGLMAFVGVWWLLRWFDFIGMLNMLVLAVAEIAVGIFMVYQAFKGNPGWVDTHFAFWNQLWGRGGLLIFFGGLNLCFDCSDALFWLCGAVNFGLGVAYVVAHFVPACCRPEPACGGAAPGA